MSKPFNDDEREDLIAYLDGEADEETAQAIEARLSLSPEARAEAETLKKAWDLLDYLPRPEPSPDFTNRTIDRLSPRQTQPAPVFHRSSPWAKRFGLGLGWAAAVVLAGVGAYAAVQWWTPTSTDRDLARDLRLIDNLALYESVESLDFLRDLDTPDLFGDQSSDS